ncbi:hypothetical protein ABNF65_03550, partial [Paenibacillus larvae]
TFLWLIHTPWSCSRNSWVCRYPYVLILALAVCSLIACIIAGGDQSRGRRGERNRRKTQGRCLNGRKRRTFSGE